MQTTIPPSDRIRRSRKATVVSMAGEEAPARPFRWAQPRLGSRICGAGFVWPVENAVSNAQVSAADIENIRLSQQALLATDYFSLAAEDMQLRLLQETIGAYQRNLQLTSRTATASDWQPRKRYHPRANPACGRASAGGADAHRPVSGRARDRHAHGSIARQPRDRRHQDRRPCRPADTRGAAFRCSAPSRDVCTSEHRCGCPTRMSALPRRLAAPL